MKNGDMPAMPLSQEMNDRLEEGYFYVGNGLTKREHFAGLAMQGYLAGNMAWSDALNGGYAPITPEDSAHEAVAYADALLAELEKSNEQ